MFLKTISRKLKEETNVEILISIKKEILKTIKKIDNLIIFI